MDDGRRVFPLWRHVRFKTSVKLRSTPVPRVDGRSAADRRSRLPATRHVSAAANPLLVPDLTTPNTPPIRRRARRLARGRELARAADRTRLRRLVGVVLFHAVRRHERCVAARMHSPRLLRMFHVVQDAGDVVVGSRSHCEPYDDDDADEEADRRGNRNEETTKPPVPARGGPLRTLMSQAARRTAGRCQES